MSPGAPAYTKDRVFKQDANVRVAGRVDVTQTGRGRLALCKGGAGLLYARRGKRHSLIAQLVEQSTVNRSVAGSSPAQGATFLFLQSSTLVCSCSLRFSISIKIKGLT